MTKLIGGLMIAVLASLATLLLTNTTTQAQSKPVVISYTEPSEQDAWVRGIARDGEERLGHENDEKPLADASNSVCFLTKVEITGQNGPEDSTGCYISLDEFTNWWQINAEKGEGTDAAVACNARCIVWE